MATSFLLSRTVTQIFHILNVEQIYILLLSISILHYEYLDILSVLREYSFILCYAALLCQAYIFFQNKKFLLDSHFVMYFIFGYKQAKTSKYISILLGVGIFLLLILSVLSYSESLDNWVLTSPDPVNQDSGGYNNSNNGNSNGNNSGGDNPGNNNPGDNNNLGNKDNSGDDNKSEKKKYSESYSDNTDNPATSDSDNPATSVSENPTTSISDNPATSDSGNTVISSPPVDLNDTGLHAEQTVEERDRIYEQFDREIEAVETQIENVMLDPTRSSELEGLHAQEANLRWLKDDYGNNGKSDQNEFDDEDDNSNDSGFEDEDE